MTGLVVSLFDYSGTMCAPWREAGYTALLVDRQHPDGLTGGGNLWRHGCDLRQGYQLPPILAGRPIAFVSCFPPCDHLAVSGARWFKGKGLRALAQSVDLFATAAEYAEASGAPYLIENPVSTISTYWRAPDYQFDPWQFTLFAPADNYTKRTCLWTGGGFVMPPKRIEEGLGAPDNRIWRMPPSADRARQRSATPSGFALAVFLANSPTNNPTTGDVLVNGVD